MDYFRKYYSCTPQQRNRLARSSVVVLITISMLVDTILGKVNKYIFLIFFAFLNSYCYFCKINNQIAL